MQTAPYVPLSAVRQRNLPPTNYHLIAIAPWVNGGCAEAYLAAAREAPVRAFLFYLPGNGTASPPPADSPQWHIHNNAGWMSQTNYPVFALSGTVGEVLMQHSSLYSGNMTEVPYGDYITERFYGTPDDYLRIWTELDLSTAPEGFATWVYVLIILGVFLVVITATSILMHSIQAWRRAGLRRRVIDGDINLEAMGIKHLTVPMAHIQKFPLYTYHYEPVASPPLSPRSTRSGRSRTRTRSRTLSQAESAADCRAARSATVSELGLSSPFTTESTTATNYQPNCEICLEPYKNRETIIRELPCGHIFHPECIDEFLHDVSSLCPICKASMLPEGYCPKITNDMVRRERAIRLLRGRIEVEDDDNEGSSSGRPHGRWRLFTGKSVSSSTSTELQETQPRLKRGSLPQLRLSCSDGKANNPQAAAPSASARERMRELAGVEPDDAEGGMPACKFTLGRVCASIPLKLTTTGRRMRVRIFPGFN
jgi:hypothetical protein